MSLRHLCLSGEPWPRRLLRDDSGVAMMTYVVFAVLLVAAVVAAVIVFGGRQRSSLEVAGHAVGGALTAAEETAEAATENFEVAMARAMETGVAIQGGEFPGGEGSASGGNDRKNAENTAKDRKHKVNHPVAVEIGHAALDLAGLIPGVGDAVDLANAAWYEKDGRHVEAVITAAAAVPVAGTAAVAVKWGNNATKLAKVIFKDGKIVKVITEEGKVLTKEGGKIAKETGKTGEKVVEKTTEKNSGNVIDINAKRAEKNAEKTVEIRKEPIYRKNGTTGKNEIVGYRDVPVENTKVSGNGSQNGNNPFANYGNGNSNIDNPVSGVSRVEPPPTVNYNKGSAGKYDPTAVRQNGDPTIPDAKANPPNQNVNNQPAQNNVTSLEEWKLNHLNEKYPKTQEYNRYNTSKTASGEYGKQTGPKNENGKNLDTDNTTP